MRIVRAVTQLELGAEDVAGDPCGRRLRRHKQCNQIHPREAVRLSIPGAHHDRGHLPHIDHAARRRRACAGGDATDEFGRGHMILLELREIARPRQRQRVGVDACLRECRPGVGVPLRRAGVPIDVEDLRRADDALAGVEVCLDARAVNVLGMSALQARARKQHQGHHDDGREPAQAHGPPPTKFNQDYILTRDRDLWPSALPPPI